MFINLKKNITVRAIELYYDQTELKKVQEALIHAQEHYPCRKELIQKMKLKISTIEANNIMIRMLLEEMTQEQQTFLNYRYGKGMNLIAISMKLHSTVSQLQRWDAEILRIVEHFLFYYYSEQILSIQKLELMLKALEKQIEILKKEEYRMIIDLNFLACIESKHLFFSELLQGICKYLNLRENQEGMILKEKLGDSKLPLKEIAQKYGVSISTASIYISKFKKYVSGMIAS